MMVCVADQGRLPVLHGRSAGRPWGGLEVTNPDLAVEVTEDRDAGAERRPARWGGCELQHTE